MKSFNQYVEEMDGLGDLSMSGTAPEETLIRIAKLIIKNHKSDYMQFVTHLAQEDQQIRNELETYNGDVKSGLHRRAKPDMPNDEVVPSGADSSSNEDGVD